MNNLFFFLNHQTIYIFELIQQSAWIIYIAQFFELEQKGLDIFNKISTNYQCHKSNLAHSGSKNIAWTTYDAVNKAWTLHYDNYNSSLIQDAGKQDHYPCKVKEKRCLPDYTKA